jgi:transposase
MKRNQSSDRVYCVDIAKDVFQVHAFGATGEVGKRRRLTRSQFTKFLLDPVLCGCLLVMEACASSHHWARVAQASGMRVKLLPAQFVSKKRHGNKTDSNDTDAIHATHLDPRVRAVPVKTLEQQDLCALHSMRELMTRQRTQLVNQVRGLLAERGVVAARGEAAFTALMHRVFEQGSAEVTDALVEYVRRLYQRILDTDAELRRIESDLKAVLKRSPCAQRLETTLGIGLVTATALAARYGDNVERFADARQFAASLGLAVSEHSSGNRRRLGSITRQGDPYIRKLLVLGGQAVHKVCDRRDDAICLLARRLRERGKKHNTIVVALANRLARIVYAIMKHGTEYRPNGRLAAA